VRLSDSIKSGTYKTVKWAISDAAFYIKVPNVPETRELAQSLRKVGDPMATYFSPKGAAVAWQWHLSKSTHRNLWLLNSPRAT
jgi:hypothetical protein